MNEPEKVTEWDLTDEEKVQLRMAQISKRGAYKLLAELQYMKGMEVEAESAWWEAVTRRLQIPSGDRGKLVADSETGKVWLRGANPPA